MNLAHLGIASSVIATLAYVPYFKEIIQGKSKPERISWLLWSVLGLTYLGSGIEEGGAAMWFLATDSVMQLGVLFLSIKYGVGGSTKLDKFSLFVAVIALMLLISTSNVFISLLTALFIDMLGAVLTLRKLEEDRESESSLFWGMYVLASALGIFSIESVNFNNLAFPVYVFFLSLWIAIRARPSVVLALRNP